MEYGSGSGSLTTSLARVVPPIGHVYTFYFHELWATSAREEFENNGMSILIIVEVRGIQGNGFRSKFHVEIDVVFLDLPQPWLTPASATYVLKFYGVLCLFSPYIEQVHHTCYVLNTIDFTDVQTFEVLLRTYEVHEQSISKMIEEKSFDVHISFSSLPCKRMHSEMTKDNCLTKPTIETKVKTEKVHMVMAKPYPEKKGH
ncbi:hypothetical protein KI387_009659, partial [Taxus chinensis]